MMNRVVLTGLFSLLTIHLAFAQVSLKVDGRTIPYTQFSSFKMPGSELALEIQSSKDGEFRVFLDAELRSTFKSGTFTLVVPSVSGLHNIHILDNKDQLILNLNVFVLVPILNKKDDYLNGFRIGTYPPALNENGKYTRPKGFIQINKEVLQTQLTPHFKLSQFVPKQKGNPKYIVIKESLLLKLEYILAEVNKAGVSSNSLFIREAYLTPYQNAKVGNPIYSRHIYGDAVQIIIDNNKDGIMDDVNADGKGDMKDTRWLFDLINGLSSNTDFKKHEGGLAHYRLNKKYGGYVYIDARGTKVRF